MPFHPLTPAEPTPAPVRFTSWLGIVATGVIALAIVGGLLLARRPAPATAPAPSATGLYSLPVDTAAGGGVAEGAVSLTAEDPPSLAVYTVPVGVEVTIDGRHVGRTPYRATELERRPYRVLLEARGYTPLDTVMHLETYPRALLAIDLVPDGSRPVPSPGVYPLEEPPAAAPAPVDDRPGELVVTVSPWGSIYVDGQLLARETDVRQTFSLPPGSHRVTAEHPELGRREAVVQVRPGQSTSVSLEL